MSTFWVANQTSKGITWRIDRLQLYQFLEENGFGTFRESSKRTIEGNLIQIDEGVVRPHTLRSIRKWVLRYVDSLSEPDRTNGLDSLVRYGDFKEDLITFFPVYSSSQVNQDKVVSFVQDDTKISRIPFKNGVVEITPENITVYPIRTLTDIGCVWETQINGNEIEIQSNGEYTDGEFYKFVQSAMRVGLNETDSDEWNSRLNSLETAIGYLVHRYNDPSVPKSVIFVDKESSHGNVEGRNGKSLVAKGLSYVIPTQTLDGRKNGRILGTRDGKFVFAGIKDDTRLLVLDDCSEDLRFDSIFSMITGDFEVERKGIDSFTIPYSKKPKFLITTNYVLPQLGTSYVARQHIVEFGSYWNLLYRTQNKTPSQVYKRRMFEDWKKEDWNDFYNYIFYCVQRYLNEGLKESSLDNYRQKQMKYVIEGNKDLGFVDWMDNWISTDRVDKGHHLNNGISIKALHMNILQDLPDLKWTEKDLKNGLWRYCETQSYGFNEHLSHKGNSLTDRRNRKGPKGQQQEYVCITTPDDIQLDRVA